MTDPSPPAPSRGERAANHIRPARARAGETPARSLRKGDLPQDVADRYLIERDLRGRAERFYRDHRTPDPAFRDTGRRLSAERTYPDTVADMLKVAQHRGWTRLKTEGDEAFRREVWVQARAMGLEVQGYRPRERDHLAAGLSGPMAPEERLRRAAVVVRTLITDQAVQARLIERAALRAGLTRDAIDRVGRPDRVRERM